jgi:prepilin-type N-terminal cleavage/methylation domain-containing protein
MSTVRCRPRRAFTLIELLVVIGIVVVVAALGYIILPPLAGDYTSVRSVDLMSEWLLTAKQRAKRDNVPTGIRLVQDPNTQLYSQVVYVQQPYTLSGTVTGGTCQPATKSNTARFLNVDFVGGAAAANQLDQALVQPGDYLQVQSGTTHQVARVDVSGAITTVILFSHTLNVSHPTPNYLFYRQPRRLSGEDVKQLPGDFAVNLTVATSPPISLNVPQNPATKFYEIVFGPSGAVIGQGTLGGKIVLCLQDNATVTNPAPSSLIAIDTHTGFIQAHPVAPGTNPYAFVEDGRAGGL